MAEPQPSYRPLLRSQSNRVLGGVCAGLGDYFNIDPTIIRILFVVFTLASGGAVILAYLLMWWLIPETGQENKTPEERVQVVGEEIKNAATDCCQGEKRVWLGVAIIAFGLMALGNSLLPWHIFRWDYFWPLAIIIIGLLIAFRRR